MPSVRTMPTEDGLELGKGLSYYLDGVRHFVVGRLAIDITHRLRPLYDEALVEYQPASYDCAVTKPWTGGRIVSLERV